MGRMKTKNDASEAKTKFQLKKIPLKELGTVTRGVVATFTDGTCTTYGCPNTGAPCDYTHVAGTCGCNR
jgi:hypothetical protein